MFIQKRTSSPSGIRHIALAGLLAISCSAVAQETPQAQEAKPDADRSAILKTPECGRAPYPRSAMRREAQGKVTVSFAIGTDGHVHDARVSGSSGHPDLDETALRAVRRCVFVPAVVDGKPVEEKKSSQYVFSLDLLFPSGF